MPTIAKRAPERLLIAAAGRRIPVAVKRNARARRLILRIDEALGLPVLTLPARTQLSSGEQFLKQNLAWLEERLSLLTPSTPFADGSVFPLRGARCRIQAQGGRGVVTLEARAGGYVLMVPGGAEFVTRRVTEFLKREARADLERAASHYQRVLGRTATAIRICDPKTRWGSCSAEGVLTFSWRLVMAPPSVLDYLAAHEVAHLREMNHGPRFWALVEKLHPGYEAARAWLDKSGVALAAVGRVER